MMKWWSCLLAAALCLTQGMALAQSQWAADIQAFEDADRSDPPPKGAVLFLGSSSIRMWTSLEEDFSETALIQRGFGGSQLSDVIYYADRIVVPYAPRLIVLYEGDNDVAGGKSAERVFEDYRTFVALVRNQLPDTRIAFVAIKPSLARWDMAPEMRRANALIAAFAEERTYLDFIDVWEPMLARDGTPMPQLFIEDGLHMNGMGYAIWTEVVRPFLLPD